MIRQLVSPLAITAGERGVIRLFALEMPPEQARFLSEPGAVAQMLGIEGTDLNPSQIDIFALDDLEELGLEGYLLDGCAISSDQINRAVISALTGHVLLIRSRAFRDHPVTLTPAPQLTLVATYHEPPTDWSGDSIETDSAKIRPSPRAARSQARRIGAILFGAVILLVAIMMIAVLS